MAIKWGKATKNPVKEVKLARENNGRIRWLTEDEEIRLLANCGPQLKSLVVKALHIDFRKSELLSLTWCDVDFSRGVITVQAAYAKNGEARSVDMNDVLTPTLQAIRMNTTGNGLVFCSRNGTSYKLFRSAFEKAVQKVALVDFTFHDLRHTFASRLVMSGIDLPTVKELMGHKDISITMRYTHLSSDHKRRAVRALEQFGNRAPTIFPTVTQEHPRERLQIVEK